jgi:CheY-like chemotaxis protein
MATNATDDRGAEPAMPVVLVVDDDEDLAETCEYWLEAGQYEARVANSGEEALKVVDETVDVVLLDRRMPTLSGDEVLAELRDRGFDMRRTRTSSTCRSTTTSSSRCPRTTSWRPSTSYWRARTSSPTSGSTSR